MATGTLLLVSLLSLIGVSTAFITYIEIKFPLNGTRSEPGSPWPLPQNWKSDNDTVFALDEKDFSFETDMKDCNILPDAFSRYKKYVFINPKITEPAKGRDKVTKLRVEVVSKDCGYPEPEDDESYDLTVTKGTSLLKANKVWGALRGLETFSQLVYIDKDNKYTLLKTEIKDAPSYSYRGVLVDSARHFLPMKILKENLDAMSFNKFNVLHWHIVDDQSFPFQSKVYPNLTDAAYSPRLIYTQEDMKEIMEFARLRGIRLIPEIDTPGHTIAFAKIFPDLITTCYVDGKPNSAIYAKQAEREILNPIHDYTYDFFEKIFEEVRGIFKDPFIHLGMDEVYHNCWQSNPEIQEYMKNQSMKSTRDLEAYYIKRTLENVKKVKYNYIIYEDPLDNKVTVPKDAIIQVWKDKSLDPSLDHWQNYIKPIAEQNYKMIFSACWYLNYISYRNNWEDYYKCNPRDFDGTDAQKQLVLGGEACMWSEYVDGTNLISRLWPRASAVGERLWSNMDLDVEDVKYRLDEQRCRMLRRGIAAQPILNGFCEYGEYEWDLDAKYPPEPVKCEGGGGASNLVQSLFALLPAILLKIFN